MVFVIFRRAYSTQAPKRFYKNVSIVSGNGGFEICLDHRKLKTPRGQLLSIPSEPLALAIAKFVLFLLREWDNQSDKIERSRMHLSALAMTATDNPTDQTCESITDKIMEYVQSDTILYTDSNEENLKDMQDQQWGVLLKWMDETHGFKFTPSDTIELPIISDDTQSKMRSHFMAYNFWALTGYQFAAEAVKSVLIAFCTVNSRLNVHDAVKTAQLEQEFQKERWGNVEWAHDIEFHELSARLAAATLFVHFNSTTHTIVSKSVQN